MTQKQITDSLFGVLSPKIFDEFFSSCGGKAYDAITNYPYDIYVTRNGSEQHQIISYNIDVALAGILKENISVKVVGEILHINVNHPEDKNDGDVYIEYLHKKLAKRSMMLQFKLSSLINTDEIKTTFVNGILTISMPLIKETIKEITIV